MIIKNYRGRLFSAVLFCFLTTFLSAQLQFEDFVYNGSGGGALMNEASSVAISPDGDYVYVTSAASNAINVFNRSSSSPTGELTFVEVIKTGINGVQGLTAAQSVVVSPDGNHVYAVGTYDDALVTFTRSPVNGTLTFVEMHKDGLSGVDGLDAPYMVKVSPDGNHVYVSATDDNAISVFNRNATTGALTFNSKVTDSNLNIALGFDISPDGNNIYATSHSQGKVVVFERNSTTGTLSFVEIMQDNIDFVDGLGGAFSTFVSHDGANVYVTGVYDNALAIFARDANDGTLSFMRIMEDGQDDVQFLAFPFHVSGSADGQYVYAVGSNDNAINVFERNPTNGDLVFKEALVEGNTGVTGMNFPVNIAVSPDGNNILTAGNGSGSAVVFQRESSGSLSFVESQTGGGNGVQGLSGPYGVTVSPDGEHVYAAAYEDNALAVFSRSDATGDLSFVNMVQDNENGVDGLYRVYSVIVSPDGQHAYATGNNDDALVTFSRDAVTGELTFIEKIKDNIAGVDGLNGARNITLSPDGNFVYVTAYYDDAISIFQRDAASGLLTFVEMVKDGVNGVDGLNGANSIAISADGMTAYATGYTDDAIARFSRNTTDGTLTYIEKYNNGVGSINGLNGAHSVIISGDGKSVYACGYNDDAVVAFSRNPSNGALAFVEMYQDGVNGVDGLAGTRAVALNPDGFHFYAVSGGENAIVLFERDDISGALTYKMKHEDGINNIDGLSGARGVAVSPFGRHIYVAGADDDALSIFSCTYYESMAEEICQGGSFTIGQNTYTEAGNYQDVLEDTYGCRSVVSLDLTVLSTSENLTASICDGDAYTLGNQTFTSTGTYQEMVTNSLGCEVATTLNLTVTSVTQVSMSAEICDGETYSVGANTFFETGTYENMLTSVNGCDSIIILDLTVNQTASNDNVAICSGDQYVFGTQTLNSSGTFQETFTSTTGCDSIVTLQLAVVNSFTESANQTICDGQNYAFGTQILNSAGVFTETFTSTTGCDSTVTLNLSVEQSIAVLVNETICEGEVYNFNGVDYTTTGIFTENLTTAGGCDSTVSLNLTVLPGVPPTLNEVICEGESYNFGDNIYTESGIYTSTFVSANGCETLVTLTLGVQTPQTFETDQTICEGEQYPFGTQMLSQSGTYVGNFNTVSGCDSTVTLNLTVNATKEYELFETICKGDIYTVGNQTYSFTGTHVTPVVAANGCDSIVTLNLTVIDINGGALITDDDGTGTGAINISVSNGTPPYSYEWSNGADTEDLTNLDFGVYTLIVSDANGCSETFNYAVDNSTGLFEPTKASSFNATVHPNPVMRNGTLNLLLTNDENQNFEIKVFDSVGRMIDRRAMQVNAGEQMEQLTAPEIPGLYYIQVTNEGDEVKSLKVIVH